MAPLNNDYIPIAVTNVGAALPIAAVANSNQSAPPNAVLMLNLAETNDTIPAIGADGILRVTNRRMAMRATTQSTLAADGTVPSGVNKAVVYVTQSYADSGITYNNATGLATINVAGDYHVAYEASFQNTQTWTADGVASAGGGDFVVASVVLVNGATAGRQFASGGLFATAAVNRAAIVLRGSGPIHLNAGDTIQIAVAHFQGATRQLTQNGNANIGYFNIERF